MLAFNTAPEYVHWVRCQMGTRLDALVAGQTRPNLLVTAICRSRFQNCCIKTRCWLVHLLRRYFISFISSLSDIWILAHFLPQFMLPPFQKRKKLSNDPRPPPHPHLLLLDNPCLLMDEEVNGNQPLRRTMVRYSRTYLNVSNLHSKVTEVLTRNVTLPNIRSIWVGRRYVSLDIYLYYHLMVL